MLPSSCHYGKLDLNHTVSSGNQYRAHSAILSEEWGVRALGTSTPIVVENYIGGVTPLLVKVMSDDQLEAYGSWKSGSTKTHRCVVA